MSPAVLRNLLAFLTVVAVARGQGLSLVGEGEVADLTGAGQAFVEVVPERAETWVGVPVRVEVRMGVEREFGAREQVPLFQRALDLSVELSTDWLGARVGGAWERVEPGEREGRTFALDGQVARVTARADEVRNGKTFSVHGFDALWRPDAAGDVMLGRTVLRFAFAREWSEDLLRGRLPVHVHQASVRAAPVALRVRPLPEAGRPPQFSGAVGRFRIAAEAQPRELEPGAVLRLSLSIEGEGNFGHFARPDVERLPGLRLLSAVEQVEDGRLHVEAELSVQSERVLEVPGIEFAYFDPAPPGRYEIVATAPLPLRVLTLPKAPMTSLDIPVEQPVQGSDLALYLGLAAGVAVLALLVWRARRGAGQPTAEEHAKAADFELGLIRPGGDVTRLYPTYLAARLGCPVPEVAREDLAARLQKAGVAAELAGRAAELARTFAASSYGSKAPKEIVERARATVRELDRVHFRV